MSEEQPQVTQFGVAMDCTTGTDGKVWPRIQFMAGYTAFVITLPPEQFEKLITGLWNGGQEQLKAAKEANAPVKRATAADLERLSHLRNGQQRR